MLRTTLKAVGVAVAVAVLAVAVIGRTQLVSLFRTGRARIQAEAEKYVDPAEELDARVQTIAQTLPKKMAALKLAIRDSQKLLSIQANEIATLTQGLALLEKDLQVLGPAVLAGQGCEIRDRALTLEEAREEAARLLRKKSNYRQMIQARTALVEKVRQQQAQLQKQLSHGEAAMAELAARTQNLQSKVALVKSAEAMEAVTPAAGGRAFNVVPTALDALERRLDERIEESQQRKQLEEGLVADDHLDAVRQQNLLAELRKLNPSAEAGHEEE